MVVMKRLVLLLTNSYEPHSIIAARRALTLITKGVAVVVVPTSTRIYPGVYLPSVIRLREYKKIPYRMQQVSKKNILMRDSYRCMYCGTRGNGQTLELEHIIPKSRGGKNTWENLVASCRKCNQKKGDRTPEEAGMKLIHRPLPATIHTHRQLLKTLGSEVHEWKKYLWEDSAGDTRWMQDSMMVN